MWKGRRNLALNLTNFGPRGTIWSASWMSGKHNPPFSTEDNGFSIVLKKKGKKKEHTLESFQWRWQTPHPLLQAPDDGHVLRPSQIQVWQDQRADEWLALLLRKILRWKMYTLWVQATYVTEKTYGVRVSLARSLRFSSSSASARRFSAAMVSGIVGKRSSLELPVWPNLF